MEGAVMTPELESLKNRLRATWIAGDFGEIATSIAAGAEEFVSRLGLKPGMRVLDVACGTGNLAIPAARAGAIVTGLDIAPNLLDQRVHEPEPSESKQFSMSAMPKVCPTAMPASMSL